MRAMFNFVNWQRSLSFRIYSDSRDYTGSDKEFFSKFILENNYLITNLIPTIDLTLIVTTKIPIN